MLQLIFHIRTTINELSINKFLEKVRFRQRTNQKGISNQFNHNDVFPEDLKKASVSSNK